MKMWIITLLLATVTWMLPSPVYAAPTQKYVGGIATATGTSTTYDLDSDLLGSNTLLLITFSLMDSTGTYYFPTSIGINGDTTSDIGGYNSNTSASNFAGFLNPVGDTDDYTNTVSLDWSGVSPTGAFMVQSYAIFFTNVDQTSPISTYSDYTFTGTAVTKTVTLTPFQSISVFMFNTDNRTASTTFTTNADVTQIINQQSGSTARVRFTLLMKNGNPGSIEMGGTTSASRNHSGLAFFINPTQAVDIVPNDDFRDYWNFETQLNVFIAGIFLVLLAGLWVMIIIK